MRFGLVVMKRSDRHAPHQITIGLVIRRDLRYCRQQGEDPSVGQANRRTNQTQ